MRMLRVLMPLIGLVWGAANLAFSEDGSAEQLQQEITRLIEQLGGDSTEARDAASKRLTEIGQSAKPQLEAVLKGKDGPIRRRSELILTNIGRRSEHARIEAFAKGDRDVSLPGWERFQRVVGEDDAARALFLEMCRCEPKLLKAYQENPQKSAALWEAQAIKHEQGGYAAPVASLAAMLFIAGDAEVDLPELSHQRVVNLAMHARFTAAMKDKKLQPQLSKLLAAWVANPLKIDDQAAELQFNRPLQVNVRKLELSVLWKMEEGVELAEKFLQQKQALNRGWGLVALGKLGKPKHIELIEPLLKDKTAAVSFQQLEIQVRDCALVALAQLNGKKPEDYELTFLQLARMWKITQIDVWHFKTRADRKKGLAKWKQQASDEAESEPAESESNDKVESKEAASAVPVG